MTKVRIHTQDFDKKFDREGHHFFTSDWGLPRKHVYTYVTDEEGYGAAEEAFRIFNAPLELLEEWQQYIAKGYCGTSLSVGDIVEVNDEEYLCCSLGWKTRTEEDCVAPA
jgi:hypothetical protein